MTCESQVHYRQVNFVITRGVLMYKEILFEGGNGLVLVKLLELVIVGDSGRENLKARNGVEQALSLP